MSTAEITEETKSVAEEDEVVSMRELLECGVHFGHQTKRWNPRMKPYIFTSRNGIHVIDLQQSIEMIKDAHDYLRDIVANGGTVLFVGTKKQAQNSILEEAVRSEMPYVNHRWLGGTLTNNQTIQKSIRKLKDYEQMKADGTLDKLSNKEVSKRTKAYTRLCHYLNGIKDMNVLPSALFIVDTKKEALAIKEAHKLGIPTIGLVDTNADPTEVSHPIPANDDAIRAIRLLCSIVAKACISGKKIREEKRVSSAPEKEVKSDQFPIKEKVLKETTIQPTEQKTVKKVVSEDKKAAEKPKAVKKKVAPEKKETKIAKKDSSEPKKEKKATKEGE